MEDEYRVIPGYEFYSVSSVGIVKSSLSGKILSTSVLNGYFIVSTFRDSLTETLPIHRAVALAWVENPNPSQFSIVNHKDGNPVNNSYTNLEWTDYSGNNYHAVNTGLRNDNISCLVRDFETGVIHDFPSLQQAAIHMGFHRDVQYCRLKPKMFGKLIKDRYELKYRGDKTPWFYEHRPERIKPSRYMVVVTKPDGSMVEVYSRKALYKEFQLYNSPETDIPGIANYANETLPDHSFEVRDSYKEIQYRERRKTNSSVKTGIVAVSDTGKMVFDSLTKCANYFGVDRSSVTNRLGNGKVIDGWTLNVFQPA